MNSKRYQFLIPALLSIILSACGGAGSNAVISTQDGPPSHQVDVSRIPDAVPQVSKRSKYGNPSSYVVFGKRYHVMSSSQGYKERGIASWYGSKFHGKRTSSGELYDMHAMTAAHKTLPIPTYVKVTNLKNSRQVVLKVNDRGPFHENRIIDLSHTAATKLGIRGSGTGLVEVEAIDPKQWNAASHRPTKPSDPMPSTRITSQSSATELYLQLGAFVSSHNAYDLKNRVNSVIQPDLVSVSRTLKNSRQYYRVRIGPINTVENADSLSQTLSQNGFGQARIVID